MTARVLRRLQELATVPKDQGVTITAEDLAASTERFMGVDRDTGRPIDVLTQKDFDPRTLGAIEAQTPPIERPLTQPASEGREDPAKTPKKADGGRLSADGSSLADRLKALEASQAEADARAIAAEAEKERILAEANNKLTQAHQRLESVESERILSALGAAQSDLERAKSAYETAFAAGDGKAMAEAQSQISRASAQLVDHEKTKSAFDARRPTDTGVVQRTQPRADSSIEAQIHRMNLLPAEKGFLLQHPEYAVQGEKNVRLQAAWIEAKEKGLTRGSKEYLDYMADRLGIAGRTQRQETRVNNQQQDDNIAAPVSRQNVSLGNGRQQEANGDISLSAEQRAVARSLGLSDIEYARQVQRMNEFKRQGLIQQSY